MATFRHGTSSWSEKSWVGPFYPEGTRPGDFLAVYADRFDCVEADVTYYRIPDARMVDGWARKTPDGFTLCAKFPRAIVHGGEDRVPDPAKVLRPDAVWEDCERFLDVLGRLGDKLGPLVLQFPYFNRQVFPGSAPFRERLAAFLDRLPDRHRYAVEVRNEAWIDDALLGLLRERNVALVLVDLVYMPHPADLAKSLDLVTADFAYARLIGDREAVEAATDTSDRVVLGTSGRLDRWADVLRDLLARVPDTVYAFAGKHYAGHGPATIDDLAARVAAR